MVPSIVEFENLGDSKRVTTHAKNIARGMGKATSAVRQHTYVPTVVECVQVPKREKKVTE